MGLIFFQGSFWGAYFWRGLYLEGNLCFKIDWASLIVGSKFTVFALFYFAFEGNFPSTSPLGTYKLLEGWFVLPVWGAYIWRGLYMEGHIFGILRYERVLKGAGPMGGAPQYKIFLSSSPHQLFKAINGSRVYIYREPCTCKLHQLYRNYLYHKNVTV